MITEDKVIELFCMADNFSKFFDKMRQNIRRKSEARRDKHHKSAMPKTEVMHIMILSLTRSTWAKYPSRGYL